jgi:hypothetical protein
MKHLWVILVSVFAIILAFLPFIYWNWASLSMISLSDSDVLWASILSTTVLVAINAFYIWQNRQTVQEMEKARKTEFMPHLRVELSWLGPVYLVLKATNFGKGPATNIEAEIEFFPSKQKRKWKASIFAPNETMRIVLPDGNISRVCNASANISVKGTYQDVFGQKYEITETMNVQETIDEATELMPLIEKDEVAEAIKDLKSELNRLRELGQVGQLLKEELSEIKLRLESNDVTEAIKDLKNELNSGVSEITGVGYSLSIELNQIKLSLERMEKKES